MSQYIKAFLRDEQGLTMVEYAFAGALVAAGAAATFTTLGQNVLARISDLATDVG
jgi:pilus assembly protein Flp/PilA